VQGVNVPQSATGVLEIGFEQERQLAVLVPAFAGRLGELSQPTTGFTPPPRKCDRTQLLGERRVTSDVARVQQT
jgi:hypothetical protein